MDPKANLHEQLAIARHILDGGDATGDEWDIERDRLAELVLALDEWMRNGGFSPWEEK